MASAPSNRRHRPTSNPIPIAPNPPSELLQLLEFKSWPAVLEKIRSHPHECGSSPRFRNERGYTVLHCLLAYNRGMAGEELARVVEAILAAAEEIDWGSEYTLTEEDAHPSRENSQDANTNEVEGVKDESNSPRRTGGAWRLLMDQKNQAQWSPLHLVFVQGGVSFGKVPLTRALLQMNSAENDTDANKQNRQKVLELVDRQNRTMLHHLCETRGPRDDNFEAAHFLISQSPAMLFVRDGRGNTALDGVLSRLKDPAVTTSGLTLRGDENEDRKRNYRMLKLLVSGMEREEKRRKDAAAGRDIEGTTHNNMNVGTAHVTESSEMQPESVEPDTTTNIAAAAAAAAAAATLHTDQNESGLTVALRNLPLHERESAAANPITNTGNMSTRNVLHSACRLSKRACTPDGSLIIYLASDSASKLEYGKDSTKRLAEERDESGNYALHIFLSNASYSVAEKKVKDENDGNINAEYQIVKELVAAYPLSTSIANNDGIFPLRLAMNLGLRNTVALLVEKYPHAILVDPMLENIKVFIEILICISLSSSAYSGEEEGEVVNVDASDQSRLFSTMYFLVRSRPDVVSAGKLNLQQSTDQQAPGKPPSLFKRIVRFWKK